MDRDLAAQCIKRSSELDEFAKTINPLMHKIEATVQINLKFKILNAHLRISNVYNRSLMVEFLGHDIAIPHMDRPEEVFRETDDLCSELDGFIHNLTNSS